MSGAQPKAGNIAGCVSITAEMNEHAAKKRHSQGWVDEIYYADQLHELIGAALDAKAKKIAKSFAFVGNAVDLWEKLASDDRVTAVELGSDQTSLHNP